MISHDNESYVVGPDEFRSQLGIVTEGIRAKAKALGKPVAKICFLATSGMPGQIIVPEFENVSYVGISTYSAKTSDNKKDYFDGDLIRVRRPIDESDKPLDEELVVFFDNGSNRGELLLKASRRARDLGATTITAAAMANKHGIMPDVVGAECNGAPDEPYWKFMQPTPGVLALKERLLGMHEDRRPNAIIALGNCFTAGTELAKAVGIDGRYVGGLEEAHLDTNWLEMGDCSDLRVVILGKAGANLDPVAEMVITKQGKPQAYLLPD